MDAKDFSERFLLLKNGACCGIMKKESWDSKMLIVLSPSGSVTDIYYEGNHHTGQTRFAVSKFQSAILRILSFRNAFAVQPFYCKRFPQHAPISAEKFSTWHLCPSMPRPSNTDLYVCPLSRRILAVTDQYIAEDDNCIQYPIKGADVAHAYLSRTCKLYPLHRLPQSIEKLIYEAASDVASVNAAVHTIAPRQNTGLADVPSETNQETKALLSALMTDMSLLVGDSDVYFTSASTAHADNGTSDGALCEAGMLALVEHLDGDTYLVSNAPRDTVTPNDSRRHNHLLQSLRKIQHKVNGEEGTAECDEGDEMCTGELEVEVWINSFPATNISDPVDTNPPSTTSTPDVILHLKGDYFTFYFNSTSSEGRTVKVVKKCHTTFLHSELQRRIHLLDDETHAEYTPQQPDMATTHEATVTEYTVRSLMETYCKQATKLQRYRDYILERTHRLSNTSPTGQSSLQRVLCVQEEDLQLHTKNALQRSLYSDAPTCHTIHLNSADGTAYSADLKQCFTPEEVATYSFSLLHIPLNPMAEYDIESTRRLIVQTIVAENRTYPCDCATQLSAVFADHTRMRFDSSTQIFHVMLATGRECSFTLCNFKRSEGIFAAQAYIPVVDDSFHRDSVHGQRLYPTQGQAERQGVFPMHGINCRRPSAEDFNVPQLTFYVRKMLAFHRYATTRPEHRAALLEADQRAVALARAAALQNHRQQMIKAVMQGALTPQAASMRTNEFAATLGHTAKSPMARPPVTVTPDRQVSATQPSAFNYMTPSPVPRGRVAVVSGGTTIGASRVSVEASYQDSALDSRDHSSLTYSHPSNSSHQHTPPASLTQRHPHPQPQYAHHPARGGVHVVTPSSTQGAHQDIQRTADAMAGKYLYNNVSINALHNSFGTTPPARAPVQITPETLNFETINNRARKLCEETKKIHIPHSRADLPNYTPELNAPMAKYLNRTYVKDVLEQSARVHAKNAEFLQQFQQTAQM